jgi:hypothetical protein
MLARFFGLTALLTLVLLLPSSDAQDAKDKSSDKPDSTVDADTLQAGDYVGKLLATPNADGTFTLRTEKYEPKDPNNATLASNQLNGEVQRARQLEQQFAANPTEKTRTALTRQYARVRSEQARLYAITYKDIEFHAANNMVVRFLSPPVQYDDKGEMKKLSLLDLQEMRGLDPNVPGFAAKASDLQPNQVVRATLRQAKPAPADKPKASSEGDKAKPAPKMEVSMAVIVVADDLTQVKQDNKDTGKKKKKGK